MASGEWFSPAGISPKVALFIHRSRYFPPLIYSIESCMILAFNTVRMLGCPFKRRALTHQCKSKLRSRRRPFSTNSEFFKVSEEVRDALHSRKPVVALETTIYTHGKRSFSLDTRLAFSDISRLSIS